MAQDSILPTLQNDPEQQITQDSEADSEGLTALVLQTFRVEVEDAVACMLLPAARDISHSFLELQAQAQDAAADSRNELQAAQAEVERLSRLIYSFQQAVSAVLPFQ
ncbi:hypothetical protein ABPG77_008409 [Micractinium sp. CCAP 211/92]